MENSSVLEQLVAASRPFYPFSIEIADKKLNLLCRRPSAAASSIVNQVYNDEYNMALKDLEKEDSSDLDNMRRTFERQKKERLIEYILQSERSEFLSQASSELDDLPFSDERVVTKANGIQEQAKGLYMNAEDEEIVTRALEKRAYVYAAVRASAKRNVQILYYGTYTEGKVLAFESPESISEELDTGTIDALLTAMAESLGEQKTDPLKLVGPKSSKRRTTSAKASVAE